MFTRVTPVSFNVLKTRLYNDYIFFQMNLIKNMIQLLLLK